MTSSGGDAMPDPQPRRPRRPRWMLEGETPDYRFTLANERTFLAWIRTALALLAGAVAIVQLVPGFSVPGASVALGAVLAGAGFCLAALSYQRWAGNERAMRHRRELPFNGLLSVLTVVVTVIGAAVLVLDLVAGR